MVAFTTRIAGVAFAAGLGLSVAPAQAGYVVTLTQEGGRRRRHRKRPDRPDQPDLPGFGGRGALVPNSATIITGPLSPDDYYTGLIGPTSSGAGLRASPAATPETSSASDSATSAPFTTTCFRCQKATSPTALYRIPRPIAVRRSAASA